MFDKMKELMEMQKKAQQIKRELENSTFEVSSSDGLIKISMNGSQEVKNVSLQDEVKNTEKSELERILKDTYNRAIRRSHEIAAQKMKSMTGLGLPGF